MASELLYQYKIEFYKSGILILWTISFACMKKLRKHLGYSSFECEILAPLGPFEHEYLLYDPLDLNKNLFGQMYS